MVFTVEEKISICAIRILVLPSSRYWIDASFFINESVTTIRKVCNHFCQQVTFVQRGYFDEGKHIVLFCKIIYTKAEPLVDAHKNFIILGHDHKYTCRARFAG